MRAVCTNYFDWFYYRPFSQETVVVNSRVIGFGDAIRGIIVSLYRNS